MELIRNLGTIKNKNGSRVVYGLFLCPYCLQFVKKILSHGKRDKSCGCKRVELLAKSNTGKKRTNEQKQKMSESQKGKNKSEEHKQKISKALRGKNIDIKLTKEHKEKIRLAKQGDKNPMYGKCGILSPQWNNGSSFEPYSPEFNKSLKQFILERDNYTCQNLNCLCEENMDLHVHHIDYNKKNNNPENLITLCNSCHSQTNSKKKRKYYTEFYQNIMGIKNGKE